jgi:hypothetical protein
MSRRSFTLAATLAGLLVVMASVPTAALTPNHSIFFWQKNVAVTGTLKDSVFVQKRSFPLKNVSLAAATRSSLALYDKDTGVLRSGTLRGGVYTPKASLTLRSGFTHAAGSCDTLLLYDKASGRTLLGTLIDGRFRNRSTIWLGPGWEQIVASCDTVLFYRIVPDQPFQDGSEAWGYLTGGTFTQTGTQDNDEWALLAATSDSVIGLNLNGLGGEWGTLVDGGRTTTSGAGGFATFQRLAGTPTTVLFYQSDGTECRARLVAGSYTFDGCADDFSAGWKVIVGGR